MLFVRRRRLVVDLPDGPTSVVRPRVVPPPALGSSSSAPLCKAPTAGPVLSGFVRPGCRIAIAVCDGPDPNPRWEMLTAILDHLGYLSGKVDLTVLVATGSHRASSPEELRDIFGSTLVDQLTIVNHDWRDRASLT